MATAIYAAYNADPDDEVLGCGNFHSAGDILWKMQLHKVAFFKRFENCLKELWIFRTNFVYVQC
jgi:hypothetical protein